MGDARVKVFGLPAHELFERIRVVLEDAVEYRETRWKEKPNWANRKWLYEEAVQALDALETLERMSMKKECESFDPTRDN